MTEAMPFLQKAILLSYDPRPFRQGALETVEKLPPDSKRSQAARGKRLGKGG